MKYCLLLPLCILSVQLFSQSDCDKILQYGIYNEIKKSSQSNDYKREQRSLCDQLDEAIENSSGGSSGASFSLGGFGLGASRSYSKEELKNIKKLYCENNISISDADLIVKEHSRIISGDVLNAYNQCRAMSAEKDITLKINSTDENFSVVNISLTGSFASSQTLQPLDIDTTIFQITNRDLYEAALRGQKLDKNYVLTLKRKTLPFEDVPYTRDSYGYKKKVLSDPTLIGIHLRNKSVVIKVPEITYWKEPVYVKSPLLGQIIASILDSAKFFEINTPDEWMLANGQPVPTSASHFISLYGPNVPDLRGVFLRGRNYSRADEYGNPDGDVNNGTAQRDTLVSHRHNINDPGHNHELLFEHDPRSGGRANAVINMAWKDGVHKVVGQMNSATTGVTIKEFGGNETRPKNVTVSYYIRIRVKDNDQ